MTSSELRAQIRRYFYAEHWKIGTIARELSVHPDAVRNAIESEKFKSTQPMRASVVDAYLGFVQQTLDEHPRLRATRIYAMIRDRGYTGSVGQLRRAVARLRPQPREAFLQLQMFPGEQGQVDWAHFGSVMVGRAKRALSCFVMTLSYSRALYLEFFFDQTMENFLRGHVHAFAFFNGQPRVILYDNLKSAVVERRGNHIAFHPRLIELSAHYHFAPRPCQVRAGNQKGRVERAIRYVRAVTLFNSQCSVNVASVTGLRFQQYPCAEPADHLRHLVHRIRWRVRLRHGLGWRRVRLAAESICVAEPPSPGHIRDGSRDGLKGFVRF